MDFLAKRSLCQALDASELPPVNDVWSACKDGDGDGMAGDLWSPLLQCPRLFDVVSLDRVVLVGIADASCASKFKNRRPRIAVTKAAAATKHHHRSQQSTRNKGCRTIPTYAPTWPPNDANDPHRNSSKSKRSKTKSFVFNALSNGCRDKPTGLEGAQRWRWERRMSVRLQCRGF